MQIEHLVQIYSDDAAFLDALARYVAAGIRMPGAVVVVATPLHLSGLEKRLTAEGIDVEAACDDDRYVPLIAQDVLDRLMVGGWPDEARFFEAVDGILARARGAGRPVRAFGEMVALLWGRGEQGAAVHLECLWNRLLKRDAFPLFCAYPRAGFTQGASMALRAICSAHTRVIAA